MIAGKTAALINEYVQCNRPRNLLPSPAKVCRNLIKNQIVHSLALLRACLPFRIGDHAPAADAIPSENLEIQMQHQQGALELRAGQLRMTEGIQIGRTYSV